MSRMSLPIATPILGVFCQNIKQNYSFSLTELDGSGKQNKTSADQRAG